MALAPGGTSSPGYSEGTLGGEGRHWDRDRDRENTPVAKICHTAVAKVYRYSVATVIHTMPVCGKRAYIAFSK
jgi:hypothetical protein